MTLIWLRGGTTLYFTTTKDGRFYDEAQDVVLACRYDCNTHNPILVDIVFKSEVFSCALSRSGMTGLFMIRLPACVLITVFIILLSGVMHGGHSYTWKGSTRKVVSQFSMKCRHADRLDGHRDPEDKQGKESG